MKTDQKFGVVLLMFCLVLWFFIIPTQIMSASEAIYPRFVTVWIGINSAFSIIISRGAPAQKIPQKFQDRTGIIRVIVVAIMLLAYIIVIDFFGFFIPSSIFLVICMLFLGVRSWKILIAAPSALLLFLYFLVEKILNFPLPKIRIF